MPNFPTLSIQGLFAYDDRIFDRLTLPEGMDRDTLLPLLLSECSDFCLLYPDWDFMRIMIGKWSASELNIWTAMWKSIQFEYNPLENYDRSEEISRESTGESESNSTSTGSVGATAESTATGGRTSFNSGDIRTAASDTTETESSTATSAQTTAGTTASGAETVTARAHGNIGVTTPAQMIAGYREAENFNVYDFIVNSFKNRFCIQCY